jgi:hypothetical protein
MGNELSCKIRGATFKVHTQLGVSMYYEEIKFDMGFRLDLLVNDLVIIVNNL